MYECFSVVFSHSVGSDVLQMEATTFSLGHPVHLFLHHAISFFGGSLKAAFIYVPPLLTSIQELRDRIMLALQVITADILHRVCNDFDYRVNVCRVTQGANIEGL
jgi:hypothetical protein